MFLEQANQLTLLSIRTVTLATITQIVMNHLHLLFDKLLIYFCHFNIFLCVQLYRLKGRRNLASSTQPLLRKLALASYLKVNYLRTRGDRCEEKKKGHKLSGAEFDVRRRDSGQKNLLEQAKPVFHANLQLILALNYLAVFTLFFWFT